MGHSRFYHTSFHSDAWLDSDAGHESSEGKNATTRDSIRYLSVKINIFIPQMNVSMSGFIQRRKIPILLISVLLIINAVVLLFHVSILLKFIPYSITWGGRLKTDEEMYVFETISILINVFFSFILSIKGHLIKEILPIKVVNVILWVFFAIYALNTVGNLFAVTTFEQFFAALTFLYALTIALVLLRSKTGSLK
jgi:hypothetical protein